MLNEDLFYQIALKKVPFVGDVIAKTLISYCGGVKEVFSAKKSKLLKIPNIGAATADSICNFNDFKWVEEELKFIEKHQIETLFYLDKNYPWRLKELPDSPILLYSLGNANLNTDKIVGVVGTRKITEHGKNITQQIIADLKEQNCLILSGLALGVDVCAHKAALDNNLKTVGVLAHGLDRIYPAVHKNIAQKMINMGGLLTDFPSGTIPDKENFPKRNRIVAGLCDVLVVIETAIKGGARITAEIANTYNKDILAVPGRVNDYYSQGCNYLIKENKASLLTGAEDIISLMGWEKSKAPKQKQLFVNVPEDIKPLYHYLQQKNKVNIDQISTDLNIDQGYLSLKLLELEFDGLVRSLPGKFYELV